MPPGDRCRHPAGVIRGHRAHHGLTGSGGRRPASRTAVPGSRRRRPGRRHRDGPAGRDRSDAIPARFPLPEARVRRSVHAPWANPACGEPDALMPARPALWGEGPGNDPSYPAPLGVAERCAAA